MNWMNCNNIQYIRCFNLAVLLIPSSPEPFMKCVIRWPHLHPFNDSPHIWAAALLHKMQNISRRDGICYTTAPAMVTYICSDFQKAFPLSMEEIEDSWQKNKQREGSKINHLCSRTEVICKRPAQLPLWRMKGNWLRFKYVFNDTEADY